MRQFVKRYRTSPDRVDLYDLDRRSPMGGPYLIAAGIALEDVCWRWMWYVVECIGETRGKQRANGSRPCRSM